MQRTQPMLIVVPILPILLMQLINRFTKTALVCLFFATSWQSNAAWYEARGQAVIVDGNKAAAKKNATEEALRQALLFAGASISSVQHLTDGLLNDEHLLMTASGEVHQLELTDEVWHNDYVTIAVRADITPNATVCASEDDLKKISTSHFRVENTSHLLDGDLRQFSSSLTHELTHLINSRNNNLQIAHIEPYTLNIQNKDRPYHMRALSKKANTQYSLYGEINDMSVVREPSSSLAFWKSDNATRYFSLSIEVYDAMNGGLLLQKDYDMNAEWAFDKFKKINTKSAKFWQSSFGTSLSKTLNTVVTDMQEALTCQPLTGHVVSVSSDNLSISLGRDNNVQEGDTLTLYQVKQVIDSSGTTFLQYSLYPGEFSVLRAYSNSSTIVHKTGGVIANIQENDFVVKR